MPRSRSLGPATTRTPVIPGPPTSRPLVTSPSLSPIVTLKEHLPRRTCSIEAHYSPSPARRTPSTQPTNLPPIVSPPGNEMLRSLLCLCGDVLLWHQEWILYLAALCCSLVLCQPQEESVSYSTRGSLVAPASSGPPVACLWASLLDTVMVNWHMIFRIFINP